MDRLMERSKYQEFFIKDSLESVARCKMCTTTISISKRSGTSGMRKHLQRHHQMEFQRLVASDVENGGSRKREATPSEEDSLAKQMKMIEDLVFNCNQLKKETENNEGDENSTFVSENGDVLESLLNSTAALLPNTSTTEVLLPGLAAGCSTSRSSPDININLQNASQLAEAENRSSSLEDQLLFSQTLAREAEVRAEVLSSEMILKDKLISTLQEELKMKDKVLAEERKRNTDLLDKVKKAHLEKDEATKHRMETLIQSKERLVNEMNLHLLSCTALKSDLQKENEELRQQIEELKQKQVKMDPVDGVVANGTPTKEIKEEI